MDITAIIWVTILLILAGVFDGVRDTLAFHYHRTGLAKDNLFWNPAISWRNKYKAGDPDKGQRFPGSVTVFVFVTDAWHLFQFLFLGCMRASILIVAGQAVTLPWYAWVGLWFAANVPFGLGFHLVYTIIFRKK